MPISKKLINGKVHAMDAVSSHEGGPLEEGTLDGYNLTCPWHYAIFDVRNAKVSDQTVLASDLNSYAVQIDEESGDIYVNPKVGGIYFLIRTGVILVIFVMSFQLLKEKDT
jgi:nitrite reductase/ring-hydroxylating ferredoxin subunit